MSNTIKCASCQLEKKSNQENISTLHKCQANILMFVFEGLTSPLAFDGMASAFCSVLTISFT